MTPSGAVSSRTMTGQMTSRVPMPNVIIQVEWTRPFERVKQKGKTRVKVYLCYIVDVCSRGSSNIGRLTVVTAMMAIAAIASSAVAEEAVVVITTLAAAAVSATAATQ